jgi:hypothetical protein
VRQITQKKLQECWKLREKELALEEEKRLEKAAEEKMKEAAR